VISNFFKRFYSGRVSQVWFVLLFRRSRFTGDFTLDNALAAGVGSGCGLVLVSKRHVKQEASEEGSNEQGEWGLLPVHLPHNILEHATGGLKRWRVSLTRTAIVVSTWMYFITRPL